MLSAKAGLFGNTACFLEIFSRPAAYESLYLLSFVFRRCFYVTVRLEKL